MHDLLGIKNESNSGSRDNFSANSGTSDAPKPRPKKPNIPRELQGLLDAEGWEDAVTMVPTQKPKFKEKLKKCSKWDNVIIKSSARAGLTSGDDLQIKHWVKYFDIPDYRFARYNKQIKMITYTDEEYDKYLQSPAWTKEQTDRLMELCKMHDLRFIVIHDRFTHPHDKKGKNIILEEERRMLHMTDIITSKNKTVEDLKCRFYNIQKALLKARNSSDLELEKQPIFEIKYDADYEAQRKEQLNKLFSRSKSQVGAMAALVMENRRLTQQLQKLKKAEKKSGRGGVSSLSARQAEGGRFGGGRSARYEEDPKNAMPLVPIPMPEQCVVRSVTKARNPGCFLRSSQLTAPITLQGRQSYKLMDQELGALGFRKSPPFTVPAGEVCDLYDKLRADIATYIALQRHVAKREAELETLRLGPTSTVGAGTKRKYEDGAGGGGKDQVYAKGGATKKHRGGSRG